MKNQQIAFLTAAAAVLIGCSEPEQAPNTLAVSDSADQMMFVVTATVTHNGVMQAMIEADTAFQYETLQLTEFRGLTVYFYDAIGARTSTLTSSEGTFHWNSEDMEARGNVIAVTPDGRRLATEILVYDKLRNNISGSTPFVFDGPDQHLEGDAFTSDTDFRNVEAVRPRGTPGNVDLNQ
jgi:LPS export ABC transporter protein LptC